jgi:spore maturation protein A
MLNYVWISLVVIGILAAAGNDLNDELTNPYRNGVPMDGTVRWSGSIEPGMKSFEGELSISAVAFGAFYGIPEAEAVRQTVRIIPGEDGESVMYIPVVETTPALWRVMAKYGPSKDRLMAGIRMMRVSETGSQAAVSFVLNPVRFVKLRAVTQGAFDAAAVAVTIAFGLIGIMAMWLGVMKVAEESGAVRILTRLLTPLTRRLFPDVPPDHPAVGAIIMNISANMLGLSNAATPFGLKAMEELNKLNPKIGTATNAMCTFLTINTAGLVMIPATAIAVRAAAGSVNPGVIIGTSIFGAGCATVAGLIAVKLLQRLPYFKKEDPSLMAKEVARG